MIHLVGSDARYRAHAGIYPDLLSTATDGFGNSATFTYTPITQGNYTKNSGAVFPEAEYRLKIGDEGGYFTADGKILTYWG